MFASYTFELCDRANNVLSDITTIASQKKGSYRLNRPAVWTGQVGATHAAVASLEEGRPFLSKGRGFKVRRNGVLVFNGVVIRVQRIGAVDQATCSFIAVDPMYWWKARYVRDDTGNFSMPFISAGIEKPGNPLSIPGAVIPTSGAYILQQACLNSVKYDGTIGLETATGEYDLTGPDMSFELRDFPITIADLATTLINTGEVDVVIEPFEGGFESTLPTTGTWGGFGGEDDDHGIADLALMGRLNVLNQAGEDNHSVHFDYGTGDNNATISHTEDLETLCNALWFFGSPGIDQEHYKGNITKDEAVVHANTDLIQNKILPSRAQYGKHMEIQAYDADMGDLAVRAMYESLWQTESLLRVQGRELLSITPTAACDFKPFDDYNLGDIVQANTGPVLGLELSDVSQRIYGFDIDVDTEGTERPGELIASADAE